MAEDQAGGGEFKGSSDFAAVLADVAAALDRIETGQASIGSRLSAVEAGVSSVDAGQTKLRVDVMARIDRLQDAVTAIRDDVGVNMGAVDMARQINDNTRDDVKQMREQLSVMWKQLKKAEADIRELKGEP